MEGLSLPLKFCEELVPRDLHPAMVVQARGCPFVVSAVVTSLDPWNRRSLYQAFISSGGDATPVVLRRQGRFRGPADQNPGFRGMLAQYQQ